MTTDTPDRDNLSDFPCPTHMHHHDVCDGDCTWRVMCDLKPIYDAHIKLRAAVLGEMTPERAASMYRGVASFYKARTWHNHAERFNALADAVAKLGNP